MGFRPEVDHFQPYYVFNSKYLADLRIGAGILREALQTAGKEEDPVLKVKMAKAEEEMRIKKLRFRQRRRLWTTARRRCSARNEKERSDIKRRVRQLRRPVTRHRQMSKTSRSLLFLVRSIGGPTRV